MKERQKARERERDSNGTMGVKRDDNDNDKPF
jgi:hypothetical protein